MSSATARPAARDYTVRSVAATAQILRWLPDRRATLSQICRALSLSKSTAFAILKTLQQTGLLGYDQSSRHYFLGAELLGLGEAAARQLDQVSMIRPFLHALVNETRLTGIVAQRIDERLIVVHKEEGTTAIRATMSIGQVVPAGVGAMGKILAAFVNSADPATGRVTPRARSTLQRVRQRGYSTSYQEYRLGVNAVAAPVFDHRGALVLVLCLIGFAGAMPPETVESCGRLLRDRCSEASRALGRASPEAGDAGALALRGGKEVG